MLPDFGEPDRGFRNQQTEASEEVRQEFRPYPSRLPRRSSAYSGARRPVNQEWSHMFAALGGPSDQKTPGQSRRRFLEENGLGAKPLQISRFIYLADPL